MKGTFFSSDFVRDANGDLRLLEINTDTTANYSSAISYFDYTEFINILSQNNITEVVIVYKIGLHSNLVAHLTSVLTASAPFITTITPVVVPSNSIFPTTPEDAENKFILRMAYDETAILDSEYAKGTLGLLKLFADNNDTSSVVNFYHSSPEYGTYDTLDVNLFNQGNIPDLVVKPVVVDHKSFPFYKIGKNGLANGDRYAEFVTTVGSNSKVIQQYHINSAQIGENYATSLRSFMIVYGSDLDLCVVGEYEASAVFELPNSLPIDNDAIANQIDVKHYYEFATNMIKNEKHGLLGDEGIIDNNGNEIPISGMTVGDTYPSYFVNGAPNTDDDDLLDFWSYSGNTLPDGSYATTSNCVFLFEWEPFANEVVKLTFDDQDEIRLGGGTRLLVYDSVSDSIKYVPCIRLTTSCSVFDSNGNLVPITSIDIQILETTENFYSPNMEDVDTFLIGGSKIIRLIAHNKIAGISCFPAGTKVTMEDGSLKNIEDIIEGDMVLSFNETTNEVEAKKVMGGMKPIHNDMVKYTLENGREIISTFDHPYYVNSMELASFKPELTNERYQIDKIVGQINIGDIVYQLPDNQPTTIKDIEVLPEVDTQTYIISVEDNHNFYANNVLVHNKV